MYRIHWILDTLDTGYWIQNTGFIRPNRDKDFFGFQISSQIGITFSQPIKWSNQDVFPKTFRSQMRTYRIHGKYRIHRMRSNTTWIFILFSLLYPYVLFSYIISVTT